MTTITGIQPVILPSGFRRGLISLESRVENFNLRPPMGARPGRKVPVRRLNTQSRREETAVTGTEPSRNPAATPLITVAICTRNRAARLERAVRSVLPQMNGDTELLIVDNASTDDTPAVLSRLVSSHHGITVVREMKPGISSARNAALTNARGKFVLFMDDDEAAEPHWLAAYQRFLSAPPSDKIAVVGGTYLNQLDTLPPETKDVSVLIEHGPVPKRLPYPGSLFGGNTAYHRETAMAAGMFDLQLGRREDSDLNIRLQDAGYEMWWLPGAAIRHFTPAHRTTFRSLLRERFRDGGFIAIQRLKRRRKGVERGCYRLARIIGGPFQALAHMLAALLKFPLRHPKCREHLLQASRSCGIAWGMLRNWRITDLQPQGQIPAGNPMPKSIMPSQ